MYHQLIEKFNCGEFAHTYVQGKRGYSDQGNAFWNNCHFLNEQNRFKGGKESKKNLRITKSFKVDRGKQYPLWLKKLSYDRTQKMSFGRDADNIAKFYIH